MGLCRFLPVGFELNGRVARRGLLPLVKSSTARPLKRLRRHRFGTRLVGPIVQNGLEGKLQFDWNSDGLDCAIVIPLDHAAKTLS